MFRFPLSSFYDSQENRKIKHILEKHIMKNNAYGQCKQQHSARGGNTHLHHSIWEVEVRKTRSQGHSWLHILLTLKNTEGDIFVVETYTPFLYFSFFHLTHTLESQPSSGPWTEGSLQNNSTVFTSTVIFVSPSISKMFSPPPHPPRWGQPATSLSTLPTSPRPCVCPVPPECSAHRLGL